jgi:hypothetical protein
LSNSTTTIQQQLNACIQVVLVAVQLHMFCCSLLFLHFCVVLTSLQTFAQFGVVASSTMLRANALASKFASTLFSKAAKVWNNSVRNTSSSCTSSSWTKADVFNFAIIGFSGASLGINGTLVYLVYPMYVEHQRKYDKLLADHNDKSEQNRELTASLAAQQVAKQSLRAKHEHA